MKKMINLPGRLELIRDPGETRLKLWLRADAIRDLCLGLALLRDRMVERIVIVPTDGTASVELWVNLALSPEDGVRGTLTAEESSVELTFELLEFMLGFCLEYYRDGYAAVDHIDIEVQQEADPDDDSDFTIKFPEFAPPISAEELKRRLRG